LEEKKREKNGCIILPERENERDGEEKKGRR
jgi:hypothetical protein